MKKNSVSGSGCRLFCLTGIALYLATAEAPANVVAVVSVKNPLTSLSSRQVADLFLGRVKRFPDGTKAVPIDLAEGSATRETFYTTIVQKSATQLKAYWSKIIFTGRGQPPASVATVAELKERLTKDPSTIGYIDESLVDSSVRVILH